jgi:hypothetical protein
MMKNDNFISKRHDSPHDVLNDDNGDATLTDLSDECEHGLHFRRRQARHHLVEEQEAWLCCKSTGNLEPFPIWRCQDSSRVSTPVGQAEEFQDFQCYCLSLMA